LPDTGCALRLGEVTAVADCPDAHAAQQFDRVEQ
jgi:hypothetical protein